MVKIFPHTLSSFFMIKPLINRSAPLLYFLELRISIEMVLIFIILLVPKFFLG